MGENAPTSCGGGETRNHVVSLEGSLVSAARKKGLSLSSTLTTVRTPTPNKKICDVHFSDISEEAKERRLKEATTIGEEAECLLVRPRTTRRCHPHNPTTIFKRPTRHARPDESRARQSPRNQKPKPSPKSSASFPKNNSRPSGKCGGGLRRTNQIRRGRLEATARANSRRGIRVSVFTRGHSKPPNNHCAEDGTTTDRRKRAMSTGGEKQDFSTKTRHID